LITIVDYGVGNIGSIANMLKKVGSESIITSDPLRLEEAEKIILCGIGSFDDGMKKLEHMGLVEVLRKKVMEQKTPIMGVCLGMQLFTQGSEEGQMPGLGFINAFSRKFNFTKSSGEKSLRVPHMGWNNVRSLKESRLTTGLPEDSRFYFVHSFYVQLEDNSDALFETDYGFPFTSAFEKDNIIGVQFHPEKSHRFGMKLYENFVNNY
jgi:imidazole glycerol-phosphate synthase subunit HisH